MEAATCRKFRSSTPPAAARGFFCPATCGAGPLAPPPAVRGTGENVTWPGRPDSGHVFIAGYSEGGGRPKEEEWQEKEKKVEEVAEKNKEPRSQAVR
jgi:hypothetical protein